MRPGVAGAGGVGLRRRRRDRPGRGRRCRAACAAQDGPGRLSHRSRDMPGGCAGHATGRQRARHHDDRQPGPAPPPRRGGRPEGRGGGPPGPGHGAQLGQDRRLAGQLPGARCGGGRRQQLSHHGVGRWHLGGRKVARQQPLDAVVIEGQRVEGWSAHISRGSVAGPHPVTPPSGRGRRRRARPGSRDRSCRPATRRRARHEDLRPSPERRSSTGGCRRHRQQSP